jgi:zinc-binding alcohol dehydrogenase/oxidoreductase
LHAAGLNHREVWIRKGLYARIQLPCVLGSDGAGVVKSAGPGTDAAWVGKRVVLIPCEGWGADPRAQDLKNFLILGMPRQGTMAEQIAVPSSMLCEIPEHLSFAEAAALPCAGLTAYRAVATRGEVRAGEHVLITGIGGGVATLALIFAKALGAAVSVTSSSEEKLAKARSLGAIAAVNYGRKGWEKELVAEAGRPPSVIIDGAVGEDFNSLIGLAAPGARIVVYGATKMRPKDLDIQRIFFKQLDIRGTTMGTDDEFRDMLKLIDREKLRPVVDCILPLSQAQEADRLIAEGKQMGKVVLDCTKV